MRQSKVAMQRDIKEVIGLFMRALGGAEISREEVVDLGFEADGDLQVALNEAFIHLLEFVHDRELRLTNPDIDRRMRSMLQECLDKIIAICDRDSHVWRVEPT